MVDNSVS